MFQRLWAAAAVLTTIAAPVLAQNPPAPPPQPPPSSTDTTRAQRPNRPLRPERQPPSGVTVSTGVASGRGITLDSTLLAGFRWRNIGPANMAGRGSSIAGISSPSRPLFVAGAAGGNWETDHPRPPFPPGFGSEKSGALGGRASAPPHTIQG